MTQSTGLVTTGGPTKKKIKCLQQGTQLWCAAPITSSALQALPGNRLHGLLPHSRFCMRGGKRLQELSAASLQLTNTHSLIHAPTDTILHFCLQRQTPGNLFSRLEDFFVTSPADTKSRPISPLCLPSDGTTAAGVVSNGPPTCQTWVHAVGTAAPTHSCPVFLHTHAHPACRSFGSFCAGSPPDSAAAPRPNSQVTNSTEKAGGKNGSIRWATVS